MKLWQAYKLFRSYGNSFLESLAKAVLFIRGRRVMLYGRRGKKWLTTS